MEITAKLLENLTTVKRLLGDKWEDSTKEYRAILKGVMDEDGIDNPLSVAIPMAKEMTKLGHNPVLLLAVATEMINTPPPVVSQPQGSPEPTVSGG